MSSTDNVFSRASDIRMNGESWQNAVQRAGSQLRYESQSGGVPTKAAKKPAAKKTAAKKTAAKKPAAEKPVAKKQASPAKKRSPTVAKKGIEFGNEYE